MEGSLIPGQPRFVPSSQFVGVAGCSRPAFGVLMGIYDVAPSTRLMLKVPTCFSTGPSYLDDPPSKWSPPGEYDS